ncbi:MAG: MotA/TolQ/ExbB proton channel family protein [Verrucomicrobiales bacterium]
MKFAHKRFASSLAALLMFLASCAPAAAQEPAAVPGTQQKVTLWHRFQEGGWVMWPILLCSVGTVYLVWEGMNRTSLKKVAPVAHEEAVKNYFRQGDYTGAYDYCKANPTPMTNVLRVGISMLGEGKQLAEEAMIGEMNKEQAYMSTFISYLSVMGVCTPMLGLLGTVTGMMRAFSTLKESGVGNPAELSGAIGEVLMATAAGLFIAIPAFMGFYFLRNRMSAAIHHIQDVANDLFRKMPWEALAGAHIGDEELYAALPAWAGDQQAAPAQ